MKKNKSANRAKLQNSRKTIRKQKRQEKKIKRLEHYTKKKDVTVKPNQAPGAFVRRPVDTEESHNSTKKKKQKNQPSAQELLIKERQKELKEANKLKSQMESQRRETLLKANEDEDKMIKKLEKQLGLSKAKNKNKLFTDDGLDYLLEICDRSTTEKIVAAEKHLADVEDQSDFEDDLATVTGKKLPKKDKVTKKVMSEDESQDEMDSESDMSDQDGDDDDISGDDMSDADEYMLDDDDMIDGSDMDDDDQSQKADSEDEKPKTKQIQTKEKSKSKTKDEENYFEDEQIENPFSDDEVSNLSGDDDDDHDHSLVDKKKEKPDVWEDIYGRKRDKDGNIIKEEKTAYVPPHLRNKDSTGDKNLEALRRQIKSILNKLTGSNLHWACASVERLYLSYSRADVQESLCNQWLSAAAPAETANARLQAEHAALLAVLHANVAEDVGAYFLQTLATKFDSLLSAGIPMEDKSLDNVVACLSNLYNFKIFHAKLLYDILNRLLAHLTEKNLECALISLRTVGGTLRKDSPSELKEFVQKTQRQVAEASAKADVGSRMKFLLEVLLAVKNNNLNKIPNYDPTYTEQLKKSVKAIIRKGKYITPLNISLEDLLKADERGKWWVVGSAWEGTQTIKPMEKTLPNVDQKLLELARKQRMNTDVRRSIFCVVMSAEDYMDAFEKLQRLGLKGQQEREVVHVLLACCLQEAAFNPYYALLARQLAGSDRRVQLSIQYSIWDKIKDLENAEKHSSSNLAQLLIQLIMDGTLPLSVLKVIEFSDLNKKTVRFMRQILLAIIMNADHQASIQVFQRISGSAKLKMFRESLKLFIQHFLLRNVGKSTVLSEKEIELLKERTLVVDRMLTGTDSKLSF